MANRIEGISRLLRPHWQKKLPIILQSQPIAVFLVLRVAQQAAVIRIYDVPFIDVARGLKNRGAVYWLQAVGQSESNR